MNTIFEAASSQDDFRGSKNAMISKVYDALRPLLFLLPPETAHRFVHTGLEYTQGTSIERILTEQFSVPDTRLEVKCFGETFANPVGVAAGFDKNATIPNALAALGFGHVEVGGVTKRPQAGNDRPRMHRLVEDEAIINRMGLNNDGAATIGSRLNAYDRLAVPVGVNIALSEATPVVEAPQEYVETYRAVADRVAYVAINVSCPNTDSARQLQSRDSVEAIVEAVTDVAKVPLVLKLSPDLSMSALEDTIEIIETYDVDGVIATNTTVSRPSGMGSPAQGAPGGLSGSPIEARATSLIKFVAGQSDVPIIGVGGVSDAAGAYEKIKAGATLVQLYTGLVYNGPTVAHDINKELSRLLAQDGYSSVSEAVGADQ